MNRTAAALYLATTLVSSAAIGAPRDGTCSTGTLLDVQVNVEIIQGGTIERVQERVKKNGRKEYQSYSTNYSQKLTTYTVTARFDDMVYTAQSESVFGFGFKPVSFVVNDPIQGCLRDNTLALVRPDGKEYKARIVRAARDPQPDLTPKLPADVAPESRPSLRR